jgi:protease-4
MKFARMVWKILVAIKDGLVLLLLLLFFGALYTVLTLRPSPGVVQGGALYLPLDGPVVEEKARLDPTSLLFSGRAPQKEYQERELVRAIEAAAVDSRIKAVVLDLERFGGGRQVALSRIGAAMDKMRAARKPVMIRAMLYTDDAVQLAAHASEAWIDPIGGVAITGPGGTGLYYKALLDRLQIKAHVFKVGTYKSAVEPFLRSDSSPEAKEALGAVYAAVWEDWQTEVKKARPKADFGPAISDPVQWIAGAGGDAAKAAKASGIVDQIGDKAAFGKRVAELVGSDTSAGASAFKATGLTAYLADRPAPKDGKAIAVVTIAGNIVDGNAGPGTAGGDRIADLIDKASASGEYAALVVRVDSPGGSVTASERIRAAIARMKASGNGGKGIPVAVSMGSLAASGGYWVATPADRIFAEPATVTGSIGIFAIIPSFEDALTKIGVGTDGVRTTPLSGQPDIIGGLSPQIEAVLQQQIEAGYRRFVGYVAASRHKSAGDIDKIGQGRIWDGGTARQNGLVDAFGGLDEAIAWAAKTAKAEQSHPVFLGESANSFQSLLQSFAGDGDDSGAEGSGGAARDVAALVAAQQMALADRLASDVTRLMGGAGAQAYCLECAGISEPVNAGGTAQARTWLAFLTQFLR